MSTYLDYLRARYARITPDGQLNDTLSVREGRLHFRDLDLYTLTREYGSPLELVYTPLITERVAQMIAIFGEAGAAVGYTGGFVYANATKANVAEEVIRHALQGGAHYETSSAYDIDIVRLLWRHGILPPERLIINNGFKIPSYRYFVDLGQGEAYRSRPCPWRRCSSRHHNAGGGGSGDQLRQ